MGKMLIAIGSIEFPNVGPAEVAKCVKAIEGIGRVVQDWVI